MSMDALATEQYWESRYRLTRRGSGRGSRGAIAAYKASVVNGVVDAHHIESLVDLGCGDGVVAEQLQVARYVGYDVSLAAVELCRQRIHRQHWDFDTTVPGAPAVVCDLAISLDVLFHLVDDEAFDDHLTTLFSCARKAVLIFSCDVELPAFEHMRPRAFTELVEERFPQWRLARRTPTPDVYREDTWSDFYLYLPRELAV